MEGFPATPDEGFTLVPTDDVEVSEEAALVAAERDALDDPFAREDPSPPAIPLGKTWEFDFERGRFKRHGGAPAVVRGEHALHQWLLAAAATAPGAHPVFSPEFGMEQWWSPVGEDTEEAADALSSFEDRFAEAWTQHDRVSDVSDLEGSYDPTEGILYITDVVVVVDESERLRLGPLAITTIAE
jgi:hypothetical protein